MRAKILYFEGPRKVSVREEEIGDPGPGSYLCRSLVSAVSSGTERLLWEGLMPRKLDLDASLPGLQTPASYPLAYGYSLVALVVAAGKGADPALVGRTCFAFKPHCSAFICKGEELRPIPAGIEAEDGVFFALTETAFSLVQDAMPRLGEDIAVFGLGIVGLLTASILTGFPLASLSCYEPIAERRALAALAGLRVLDPATDPPIDASLDTAIELSGNPAALDSAIPALRFSGVLVVGSWYGERRASVDLGAWFHRARLKIVSSQVSSIAPELSGRWTRERRTAAVWETLRALRPSRWISQRLPLDRAAEAYRADPSCIQTLFSY